MNLKNKVKLRNLNFRMYPDTLRALVHFLNPKRRGYRGGRKQMTNTELPRIMNYCEAIGQTVWHYDRLFHTVYRKGDEATHGQLPQSDQVA